MKHFFKYLTALLAIAILSCDSGDEVTVQGSKEYFPLRTGAYYIYDVTETLYTLGQAETFNYEIKMEVVDSVPDFEGDYRYIIFRSRKNEGENDFSYIDTWSARVNSREVVVNEENVSFLKLKTPVKQGDQWNGNTYNAMFEEFYKAKEVDVPKMVAGITFDDCIVVEQKNNEDFIVALDQRTEIYAHGVGLVEKQVKKLNYCSVGPCLGQQQIESGVILQQTIKSYGVE